MKTMAPEAPTSQTRARWSASTPGAARAASFTPPAVAAYAIIRSYALRYSYRQLPLSCPAKAGHPVLRAVSGDVRRRRLLDRPVKPGDDSAFLAQSTQYAFSFLISSETGVFRRM